MVGKKADVLCPRCREDDDVISWNDEIRGRDGVVYLKYYECRKCGYVWMSLPQIMLNIIELVRVEICTDVDNFERKLNRAFEKGYFKL